MVSKVIKRFIDYIELRTKITSIFAFLITLGFLFYHRQPLNIKATLVFFAAMFLFDLATTAINNYIDTKTNDQKLQFPRKTALAIIYLLVGISSLLGLYLVYITDLLILALGGLCFLCGILYTYGPVPISRQPLGELLSGVFYGFFIPFILLYINMPKGTYLSYGFSGGVLTLELNLIYLFAAGIFSIVPICNTANIMLANNICDLQKDITVKRYTLPYYLGEKSLYLFAGLYYLAYIAVIVMVGLKILPVYCLLLLITLIPVQKNIRKFFEKQEKEVTFILSIKNYIMIMGSLTILIFISGLIAR